MLSCSNGASIAETFQINKIAETFQINDHFLVVSDAKNIYRK